MDQVKIGKFIAECRKKNNLTQLQLAEKLGITDRAVSKWENGKTMPDSSIMLMLCDTLQITVNDLLNGEAVSEENYTKKLEERVVELASEKERSDKLLIWVMSAMLIMLMFFYTVILFIEFIIVSDLLMCILYLLVLFCLVFGIYVETRVFQQAGYYRCESCGYTYMPSRKTAFTLGLFTYKRPRLRCRHCGKKTRHKKVYTKE